MSDRSATGGSTHGHTVLRWLAETPMNLSALADRVGQMLGPEARFHTCDREGLALGDLIDLLAERGKIVRVGEAWTADLSRLCDDA